jgi:hypothetical protein
MALVKPLHCHKFHKIEIYFGFEVLKENFFANFQRILELFTQKIVTKLSKIWIWDPGSGQNLFRIADPGSKGQKGTGSRIRIRNTDWYHTLLTCYLSRSVEDPM